MTFNLRNARQGKKTKVREGNKGQHFITLAVNLKKRIPFKNKSVSQLSWLEYYTDNVGVDSSSLSETTILDLKKEEILELRGYEIIS